MGKYSQEKRPFKITTPVGADVLLLEGFTGDEGVSTPFSYTVDMVSEDASIAADDLLRKGVTLTVEVAKGEQRYVHGLVSRFVQMGHDADLTWYQAQVVPWFWFLSLTRDCRIFQNMTVLEIAEQIFDDNGYSDFQNKCTKSYPKREYCVQYRESAFAFLSRMFEEEGIFYYFDHTKSKHVLTLADTNGVLTACDNQSAARLAARPADWQEEGVVTMLQTERNVFPGKATLNDYDYLKPSSRLESSVSGDGVEEQYDYPGMYTERDEGDRYARIRLEEHEALQHVVRGQGTCASFRSGYRFDMKEHFDRAVNQTYVLTRVSHAARGPDYRAAETGEFDYSNTFVAIPSDVPFRPPRVHPRPMVRGTQTAVVVGKAGEEIWVDKHGRVKIQFYWDREGKRDENSSCWVRVSTAWAGKGWGTIQIPRIGQEVIVDFLEGDPSQPIVTGRVYNADQTPPYDLPSNQTMSGVKSRSAKGGSGSHYNEFRFEDKKGSEEILLHAEKDLTTEVENDEKRTVDNDRTTIVGNKETKTVKKGDEKITLEQGNQSLDIKMGNQTVTLDKGNQEITLKMGNRTTTLKMGNQETTLDLGNVTTTAKLGNITTKANVGKQTQEALQGIELKVGPNSIKIDPSGVTIKGIMVKVQGQAMTQLKSPITQVNGDGILKMQGGLTMIN